MDIARAATSPISKSVALALKERGLLLQELAAKYANVMFKKLPSQLSQAELDKVRLMVVERADVTNPGVNSAHC